MKSFEERLERLEEISLKVNDQCPLEEALQLFEEGITLSHSLEKELEKIERKVQILQNPPETTESASAPAESGQRENRNDGLALFPDLDE